MKKKTLISKISLGFLTMLFCTIAMAETNDPFETVNRSIYKFNQTLDENIFEPVARVYKNNTPQQLQNRVSNFSSNIGDVSTFGNQLAQFELLSGAKTFSRILVNSTVGLFGLFDVASEFGVKKTNEDFGQTLATWGVPEGPYVVIPLLGSSTLRDSMAKVIDSEYNRQVIKELNSTQENAIAVMKTLDLRAKLLPISNILKKSDDAYIATRSSYLQKRKFDVYNGNLPDEDEF